MQLHSGAWEREEGRMPIQSETELYEPIKQYWSRMGYEVRGEVGHCDVVALRGEEPPVIVELKRVLNLPLLVQGMNRLAVSGRVYIAFEKKENGKAPHQLRWSEIRRLCERLGLGLMTVRFYKRKPPFVEVLCHPERYDFPVKKSRRAQRLLNEFQERSGDYNTGGSSKRKLVTAYREQALMCAYYLKTEGPLAPRQIKERTGCGKTAAILQRNVYRWFTRLQRGIYGLTEEGEQALIDYAQVVEQRLYLHVHEKSGESKGNSRGP
ncbi:DUF2161 domain-containing phosphodiesterase [Paenibacillus senegalensis]|uniref:DUF2161 domain-containing phosphodiesterase n=1 Tax=Paenibacillus senegalensis TaxID=1465766 RepID=UPI000289F81B|nr:DUF2161 family putative PD-(D/E)XK-type phosphodiesterase [Paenibacillus senegalensis]